GARRHRWKEWAGAGPPVLVGAVPELAPSVAEPDSSLPESGQRPSVIMPTSGVGLVVAAPIVAYRRWISPVLPPRCRFYPSCSEYALTAIAVHGPWRGVGLAIRRLLRCHPFHPGGIDSVPTRRPPPAPATTQQEL